MTGGWGALMALVFYSASALASVSAFETNPDKAFQLAAKNKKPLLINFYGIWCPPCNQMEENVYQSPAFLEKAKGFQLLRLDADAKASWKVKSRYKVGGYPTVVFTDSKGEETYRVVGGRSLPQFLRAMDTALSSSQKPYQKACASADTEDLWRCALISMELNDVKAVTAAFQKLQPKLAEGSAREEMLSTFFVDKAEGDEAKRLGYEDLLAHYPQSPMALVWASAYLGLEGNKTPKKDLVEKALSNYDKMKKDPKLEELGLADTDLPQIRADVLEKLDQKDKAKSAWAEAAALLGKKIEALPAGVPARGYVLERVGCLEGSGDVAAALKLADEYRAKYPDEFTFHYMVASMLNRQKLYGEAILAAKESYSRSYGDNRIRAATLLVKLYATVPDRGAARKVYDDVKKEIRPETKLEIRTHRYLKGLDTAWAAFPGEAVAKKKN